MSVFFMLMAAFWGGLAGYNGYTMIVDGSQASATLFGVCATVAPGYLILAARARAR